MTAEPARLTAPIGEVEAGHSLWQDAWLRLRKNKMAVIGGVFILVLYGAISGYLGGRVDVVLMRLVDILYSLPFVIFVILLMVVFGRNIILLFMAIGAVEWLDMARI